MGESQCFHPHSMVLLVTNPSARVHEPLGDAAFTVSLNQNFHSYIILSREPTKLPTRRHSLHGWICKRKKEIVNATHVFSRYLACVCVYVCVWMLYRACACFWSVGLVLVQYRACICVQCAVQGLYMCLMCSTGLVSVCTCVCVCVGAHRTGLVCAAQALCV